MATILIVLGAGASKSMESKDGFATTPGISSRRKEMPLGDQLVQKISEYDKKSLAWLLASILYQIRSKKYFDPSKDSINPDPDFLDFGRFVERIFPEKIIGTDYYLPEEGKRLHDNFNKKFGELFDPSLLKEINNRTATYKINIDLSFGLGRSGVVLGDAERRFIREIQSSEFLVKKYQQKFDEHYHGLFANIVFFELVILLLRKSNYNLVKNDFFCESVYRFVEATCREILSINESLPTIRRIRLRGGNLSPYSIYSEYAAKFDQNIEKLKKIFNESLPTIDDAINEVMIEANLLLEDYNSHSQSCYNGRNKGINILNCVDDGVKAKYANSPDELFRIAIDTIFVGQRFSMTYQFKDIFGIKIEGGSVLSEVPLSSHFQSFISTLEEVKNSKEDATKISRIIAILRERGLLMDKSEDGFFSCIQSLIKILRKFMFTEAGLSLPSFEKTDRLKQIFLSSKIVGHYKPQSIDYFMLNLDFFAPYESWDRKGEEYKEMDESAKVARKKVIQKHTKFIISNILIDAATHNYHQASGDDYINKMIWIINRTSHFHRKSPSSFIKEHVNIITFNYEFLFEHQLFNRISSDDSYSFLKNTIPVYGKISLKNEDNIPIHDVVEDGLWQSIFLSENDDFFIGSSNGIDWNKKYSLYKDVFGQLFDSMKWIGECDSEEKKQEMEVDRKKMVGAFDKATDIYFLGFGFDLNNLYQIGLIDKEGNLQIQHNHKRRFYVAGGNARILNTIKTVFSLEEHQVITTSRLSNIDDPNFIKKGDSEEVAKKIPIQLTNHLYRLISKDKNIEFVVSDKMLPEALDDFGT